jgi:osmotically inducible protein OsmC
LQIGHRESNDMPIRNAEASWEGSLKEGSGHMRLGSGVFEGPFSFGTRFEDRPGTNPEELIGAAHAGCFSMALAFGLGNAGFTPKRIQTRAAVSLEKAGAGFGITRIRLTTEAQVPEISEPEFQRLAAETKNACPVSKALTGTKIELDAKLIR